MKLTTLDKSNIANNFNHKNYINLERTVHYNQVYIELHYIMLEVYSIILIQLLFIF